MHAIVHEQQNLERSISHVLYDDDDDDDIMRAVTAPV